MNQDQLILLVQESLAELDYSFVDMEYNSQSGVLRIFFDKEGGVAIVDCERASRHLSYIFSVKGFEYKNLEMSSPGLDRPLRTKEDYAHFSGRLVQVTLRQPLCGSYKIKGHFFWDNEQFYLQIVQEEQLHIELENIKKVRLVPVFGPV